MDPAHNMARPAPWVLVKICVLCQRRQEFSSIGRQPRQDNQRKALRAGWIDNCCSNCQTGGLVDRTLAKMKDLPQANG